MSSADETLKPMEELSSSDVDELLDSALGSQSPVPQQYGGSNRYSGSRGNSPKKNYHNHWLKYTISIFLVILIVVALYYLNVDTPTENQTRYRVITLLIVLFSVLHLLWSNY